MRFYYIMSSLKGVKFILGPNKYKYTAILPNGTKVNFGDKNYEHFKDSVPKELGGGIWSFKDHNDKSRRDNYIKRHSAEGYHKVKYSPAWFSYNYLW